MKRSKNKEKVTVLPESLAKIGEEQKKLKDTIAVLIKLGKLGQITR